MSHQRGKLMWVGNKKIVIPIIFKKKSFWYHGFDLASLKLYVMGFGVQLSFHQVYTKCIYRKSLTLCLLVGRLNQNYNSNNG